MGLFMSIFIALFSMGLDYFSLFSHYNAIFIYLKVQIHMNYLNFEYFLKSDYYYYLLIL